MKLGFSAAERTQAPFPLKKGTNGPLLTQSVTLFKRAGYFSFYWNRYSMEFLQSLRRRYLVVKPSQNVGSFLTPLISAMKFGLLDFCLIGPVLRFSGIVRWGNEIQRILDDGRLLLQQTRAQDITSPITVLLEGWYQLFYWLRWKWRQGGPRRGCPTDFALTSPCNESLNSDFKQSSWLQ